MDHDASLQIGVFLRGVVSARSHFCQVVYFVPDAAQLGAVVMAIDDVVQDLQHQLPQLVVLHQRDGEERIEEGRRQGGRHGLGLKARGYLRSEGGGVITA